MRPVRLHPDLKGHAQEIQVQQGVPHGGRKGLRGLLTGLRQFAAGPVQRFLRGRHFARQGCPPGVIGLQEGDAVPPPGQGLQDLRDRRPVLVLAAADHIQPLFDLRQPARIKGETLHVVGHAAVEIRQQAVDLR